MNSSSSTHNDCRRRVVILQDQSHPSGSIEMSKSAAGRRRSSMMSDCTETTMFSEDYSEDIYVDNHWEELDDLQQELRSFDLRRRASAPVLSPALLALVEDEEDDSDGKQVRKMSLPTLLPSQLQAIEERIARAEATNGYFQSPHLLHRDNPEEDKGDKPESPTECLKRILQGVAPSTFKSETWEDYFEAISVARLAAHSIKVSSAIRRRDVKRLRKLHEHGVSFHGCNQQGESMISLACRLGYVDVVQFLVEEAQVNIRVQDDAGRNPLHDAAWNCAPNFELILLIMKESPEMLFIEDKRGFTALNYIPKSCWSQWCEFFEDNQTFLKTRVNDLGFKKTNDQLENAQERLQALVRRAASAIDAM